MFEFSFSLWTGLDVVFEGVQVEGSVEETLQLQKMGFLVSSGRGGGRSAAGIPAHRTTAEFVHISTNKPPSVFHDF